MGYVRYDHASVSVSHPRAFGVCDRCGFVYNHDQLRWQFEWRGFKLQNLRILVCRTCMDKDQQQLRQIIIPADPVPILNPRPGEFGSMAISSNPDPYQTIVPSQLVEESSVAPVLGTIGDRTVIVTEQSSIAIVDEFTVTPTISSSGYTGPDV